MNEMLIFFKIVPLSTEHTYSIWLKQLRNSIFDIMWNCPIEFLLMSFMSSILILEFNSHFKKQEKVTYI